MHVEYGLQHDSISFARCWTEGWNVFAKMVLKELSGTSEIIFYFHFINIIKYFIDRVELCWSLTMND